jgi:hypothetical protein
MLAISRCESAQNLRELLLSELVEIVVHGQSQPTPGARVPPRGWAATFRSVAGTRRLQNLVAAISGRGQSPRARDLEAPRRKCMAIA